MLSTTTAAGLTLRAAVPPDAEPILSPEARSLLAALHNRFEPRRRALLSKRATRQKALDDGARPTFPSATAAIRASEWRVAATPPDLQKRHVEITGPVDRKMMINALNSGADVFMADFEDATSPTWRNMIAGQRNCYDAVRGTIAYRDPRSGKSYQLNRAPAVLMIRPRGWHLAERHVVVDDQPIAASLFDFGLYFFHNAHALVERGSGPYFYLAKLESYEEARLWNDVFLFAQETLGLARGTVRATVLIETIQAAFEMDEILYELRDHAAGLNAGRWDYIFSVIKKFAADPGFILPDRARVTMSTPFMHAYTERLVQVCHRRGAHAIGGMAAFIPNRRDAAVTERALAAVRADKQREVAAGCDGTWVAHPDLVPVVRAVFDAHLNGRPHQKEVLRDDVRVSGDDLIEMPDASGAITVDGARVNIRVALIYLAHWLAGQGAVAIDNLMEDTATAEISRGQLWQWRRHAVRLADGRRFDDDLYLALRADVLAGLAGDGRPYDAAAGLLDQLVLAGDFIPFLTLPAYDLLCSNDE